MPVCLLYDYDIGDGGLGFERRPFDPYFEAPMTSQFNPKSTTIRRIQAVGAVRVAGLVLHRFAAS